MIDLCLMHVPGNCTRSTNAKHLVPCQIPSYSVPLIRLISPFHRTLITPVHRSASASASVSVSGPGSKCKPGNCYMIPFFGWVYSRLLIFTDAAELTGCLRASYIIQKHDSRQLSWIHACLLSNLVPLSRSST